MGYYLTFGIVTLGDSKEFTNFINSLYDILAPRYHRSLQVLVEPIEERQHVLAAYCKRYGFKPEALEFIFNELNTQNEYPQYKEAISNIKINDVIANKEIEWAKKTAAFIFNVYNEYLLDKLSATTRFLRHDLMPDYHVIFCRRGSGIIFIPLIIPEATIEEIDKNAQIIGWRTVDPELLERLEDNFQYYWDLAQERPHDNTQILNALKKSILQERK
jgi:hypothetical protein